MKKIFGLLTGALSIAVLLNLGGCYYDNYEELHPELLLNTGQCDTSGVISYSANIVPILKSNCGSNNSCHNSTGAGGGVILDNYNDVKSSVNGGRLWSAIVWDGNAAQMPKNSSAQIKACYMAQIYKWINSGAPNN
jgi:hypothetical protein